MSEAADLEEVVRISRKIGRLLGGSESVVIGAIARVAGSVAVRLDRRGVMTVDRFVALLERGTRARAEDLQATYRDRGEA
jgi:hypothetical protein